MFFFNWWFVLDLVWFLARSPHKWWGLLCQQMICDVSHCHDSPFSWVRDGNVLILPFFHLAAKTLLEKTFHCQLLDFPEVSSYRKKRINVRFFSFIILQTKWDDFITSSKEHEDICNWIHRYNHVWNVLIHCDYSYHAQIILFFTCKSF